MYKRQVRGAAAGGVAAGPFLRAARRADDKALGRGAVLRVHLTLVVAAHVGGGHLQRGADIGVDAIEGSGHLGRVDADARRFGAVEAGGQLPESVIPAGHHLGDDGADCLGGAIASHLGPGKNGRQVTEGTAQVESPEHPLTLPATKRGLPGDSVPAGGQTGSMASGSNKAELSSIAAQLDDLARRVEELASATAGTARSGDR